MTDLTDAQLDELERLAKSAIEAGEMRYFDCHHLSHHRYVEAVIPPTVLALVREVMRLRGECIANRLCACPKCRAAMDALW